MKIVVTGATSFLGAASVRTLLAQGHQVYAVVRPGSANRGALPESQEGLTVLELELSRLHEIGGFIGEGCDAFLHFGWDGSGSENRKKPEIQQQNVEDSMKALKGALSLGCGRFLFGGSQAEYGQCRDVMGEDRKCRPVSEYGKAKLEFGRRAREFLARQKALDCTGMLNNDKLAGMEYVHARIFSVYGPGDHPWSLVNTCLDTFRAGKVMELGACSQYWNFLYIDDLVQALLGLLFWPGKLKHTVYNVAAGPEATRPLREYVEEMHVLCGGKGSPRYGCLPPNAEGPANLIPDIRRIQEEIGWTPKVTFAEGIRRMLEGKDMREGKDMQTRQMEQTGGFEQAGQMEQESRAEQAGQAAPCLQNEQRRDSCLLCGEPLPANPLLFFDGMPASAQNIPDAEQVADDRGIPLKLHRCPRCGLVQFDCRPVDYYRDVIRSGGYSTTMTELRRRQYRHLIEGYGLEGKKFLEVGCGQGEFLSVLTEFPVKAYGVEHKKDLVEIAREKGLSVWEGFTETADTVLGTEGPYDAFLSFNFLEHQPDPGTMLECIRANLAEEGMGLITVPSLEYILQYDGYYELIRDHIAYYRFDTLEKLMNLHGFQVLEKEMVNRDTCSVIVRKVKERREPEGGELPELDFSSLEKSQAEIRRQTEELRDQLAREKKTLALWGASHQGFTLAATTCLGETASYIMDSAPFKQGRFAPASHLPIVAPEYFCDHPVDVILIVAPGYTEEIAKIIRSRFSETAKIMTMRSDRLEVL